jgi:hypothetical protein
MANPEIIEIALPGDPQHFGDRVVFEDSLSEAEVSAHVDRAVTCFLDHYSR